MTEATSFPLLDPPTHGHPVEVMAGITRLTAPNPSVWTGPGTNTYLVGHDSLVAIDPGPDDDHHASAVAETAAGRLKAIVVTHTHLDHSPGAKKLAELTGATVLGFEARDGFEPDRTIGEGDIVDGGDLPLMAVHTPGHASNHLSSLVDIEGVSVLFSGDHVMGGSTVVIAPPDGDMAAYLESLERLLAFDPPINVIAPGHGPMLALPELVVKGYIDHRLQRESSVLASLEARRSARIEEIVTDVYTDVPEALHPIARFSVWAHLRKLANEGSAHSEAPDDVTATWTATK